MPTTYKVEIEGYDTNSVLADLGLIPTQIEVSLGENTFFNGSISYNLNNVSLKREY